MAIQFLQEKGLGGQLGQVLGTGLGLGLDAYQQNQQQAKEKEKRDRFSALLLGQPTQPPAPGNAAPMAPGKVQPQMDAGRPSPDQMRQQLAAMDLPLEDLKKGAEYIDKYEKEIKDREVQARKEALELEKEARMGKTEERKVQSAERQASMDKRKAVVEFSKPYQERRKSAEEEIKDLDLLEKLAKSGKLRSGNTQQILSKLGLEGFNRNLETEVADKVMARLAQGSAGAFGPGARITNYLEQTFQRSLATLWNTKEGIEAIVTLNRAKTKAHIIKDDIRKQLIKENNGNIPFNGEDIVDDRAREQVEKVQQDAMDKLDSLISKAPASQGSSFMKKSMAFGSNMPQRNQQRGEDVAELPSAASMPGKYLQFPDGSYHQSNGKEWVKVR